MGGKCNWKNVIYQATIFPKENEKEKKSLYWNFASDGSWDITTMYILSHTNT